MKLSTHLIILIAILAIFLMLIHLLPGSIAERRGPDSTPPDEGEWVINSPGNYIGNETIWASGEPPNLIIHDDAVVVNGSITIRNGGELTLFNTTINMTDHILERLIIKEGGTLIMRNWSAVMNNNGSLIGAVEIEGTLDIDFGFIQNALNIYVNSSDAELKLGNATFMTNGTFFLRNQETTFNWVSFYSLVDTPLIIENSNIDWTGGAVAYYSNITSSPVMSISDSSVIMRQLSTHTSSDDNIGIHIERSTCEFLEGCSLGHSQDHEMIMAIDSTVVLSDLRRFSSNGDILADFKDSNVTIRDTNVGHYKWHVDSFMSTILFDNCEINIENARFHRFDGSVIQAEDSNLSISNGVFWNVTSHALDLETVELMMNDTAFYNIMGDAIHMYDSTAQLVNITFDEDDKNFTDGYPYPPIYSGWGSGIYGHSIFAEKTILEIVGSSFAAHEMDAIHVIDSDLSLRESIFRSPGENGTNRVNGISMENSTGTIEENEFYTPYRKGGFVLLAQDRVPFDMEPFLDSNNFSGGRIVQQLFTMNLQVVDESGIGVRDVEVNLTNKDAEDRKLTTTLPGGWVRNPFNVPAFEIYLKNESGSGPGEGEKRGEDFSNESYNDYHLRAIKEYRSYNFTVSSSQWITIDRSMDHQLILAVSTPDLLVKGAGVFPMAIEGGELELTAILQNHAEGPARDVVVSFLSSPEGSEDWTLFGSVTADVPGIFDGGNHTIVAATLDVSLPRGTYNVLVVIDPDDLVVERNETNNNFAILDPFQVYSAPRATIIAPGDGHFVNGSVLVSGHSDDDYENDINLVLVLDGVHVTIPEISKQQDGLYWNFTWDTTEFDDSLGFDMYPNGVHSIAVMCTNSNPSGFDYSQWFNITVEVTNAPVISIAHPLEGEFVNVSTGVPLYQIEVDVQDPRDLGTVRLSVDDGQFTQMTSYGTTYRYNLDTSKYADGEHHLDVVGIWGYGNVSQTVSFDLNSPSSESKPKIFLDHTLDDEELRVFGSAWDDNAIIWIKVRLDDGEWILLEEDPGNTSNYEYSWGRGELPADTHNISVRVSDGYDTVERVMWFQVDIFYDLTITDIIIPYFPTENDWVNFTIKVKNTGPYASPEGELILYIGNIMRTIQGISVPSNSEIPIQVSWHAKPGNHTISATINNAQRNLERDPTNNVVIYPGVLIVEALPVERTDEESGNELVWYAAGIALIFGIMAIIAYISRSRGQTDEQRSPHRRGSAEYPASRRPSPRRRPVVRRPIADDRSIGDDIVDDDDDDGYGEFSSDDSEGDDSGDDDAFDYSDDDEDYDERPDDRGNAGDDSEDFED